MTVIDPADPERVEGQARRLDDVLDRAVAVCMQAHGFSQLQAVENLSPVRAPLRRPVLGVHAVELGPVSATQARRYGIRGTYLLFVDPPSPVVESSADDYHAALSNCVREVPGAVDTYEMLAGWNELMSELRTQLLTQVDSRVRALLRARLRCVVRHGYPSLDTAAFLVGDTDTALQKAHIAPGVTTPAPADPPQLPPRVTRILTAPPKQAYTPTAPEIGFALKYVACAQQSAFQRRLAAIVAPAAERLASSHRADVNRYDMFFRQELNTLMGYRG